METAENKQVINTWKMIYRLMDNVKAVMYKKNIENNGNISNQDIDNIINYINDSIDSIVSNAIGK